MVGCKYSFVSSFCIKLICNEKAAKNKTKAITLVRIVHVSLLIFPHLTTFNVFKRLNFLWHPNVRDTLSNVIRSPTISFPCPKYTLYAQRRHFWNANEIKIIYIHAIQVHALSLSYYLNSSLKETWRKNFIFKHFLYILLFNIVDIGLGRHCLNQRDWALPYMYRLCETRKIIKYFTKRGVNPNVNFCFTSAIFWFLDKYQAKFENLTC